MKKICTSCHSEKELSEFYKKKGGKLGTHAECKQCSIKRWEDREKYIKNISDSDFESYRSYCQLFLKQKANRFLNKAIEKKWVVKPEVCAKCNKKCILHAYHQDYSNPFDVLWLCSKCKKL